MGSVAALLSVLGLLAVVPHVLDELHRHHISTLPTSLDGYTAVQAGVADAERASMQASLPARMQGKVTHIQVAAYNQDGGDLPALILVTAELPAGSQRHVDEAFEDDDGTDPFHDVTSPPSIFGGKVKCLMDTVDAQPTPACGWVDNGTFGLLLMPGSDEATVIALLGQIRPVVEH